MGTSCVALSIKNIKLERAEKLRHEKMGGTLPSTGMWQGEVFAISDCLVTMAVGGGLSMSHVCKLHELGPWRTGGQFQPNH